MKKTRGVAYSKRPGCLAAVLLGCIGLVLQSVSAFAAVETEPNDKLGMANPIVAGEGVTGAFTPPGDQDWHAITLATPGRLRCSVTSPPANIRAYITLYNRHADYLYVTSAAVNDGDDVYLTYDAP